MASKTLYLLCGIPGSGKSFWAKHHADMEHIWVSRDEVRFSMLKDGDEYFKYENLVFSEWINRIQKALDNDRVQAVYADATHINERSRIKTLRNLRLSSDIRVIPVVFNTPYETCYYRNKNRTDRARVPNRVMWQMHRDWEEPSTKKYPIVQVVDYKKQNDDEKYLHHAL